MTPHRGGAPARARQALADERGAGGVTALGTVALGASLVIAVAALGAASVTASQAAGAADLAALAASDARRGITAQEPCALAAKTAERNHARVLDCSASPQGSVRVEVEVARVPLPPARAVAVAGPPSVR